METSTRKEPDQSKLTNLLELYQSKKYVDAEELAISLTQEFPESQFAWKVLAAVYRQTGKIKESLAISQKSVLLAPLDAEAHFNLGNTLKDLESRFCVSSKLRPYTPPTRAEIITINIAPDKKL